MAKQKKGRQVVMYPHHQIPAAPQPQIFYLDDQQQSEPESNPWKAVGALSSAYHTLLWDLTIFSSKGKDKHYQSRQHCDSSTYGCINTSTCQKAVYRAVAKSI
jgi:hypothetical protein